MDEVKRDINCYFGLTYASWLTIPRVFLEQMPLEWQHEFVKLLDEYEDSFKDQPDIGTRVQITKDNKLVKTPDWLLNYRRPDYDEVYKYFKQTNNTND